MISLFIGNGSIKGSNASRSRLPGGTLKRRKGSLRSHPAGGTYWRCGFGERCYPKSAVFEPCGSLFTVHYEGVPDSRK